MTSRLPGRFSVAPPSYVPAMPKPYSWPPEPHRSSVRRMPTPFPPPAEVWAKLTPPQRVLVRDHRHDWPLPADVIQTLASAGAVLVGTQWQGEQQGYSFFLSEPWIEFLESPAADD